ncbi:fimbrillin family protein [Bacteroides timonensis]|uniref:fimbrillin family protein n=1 Tax=Bacteroides timonensis TaxID=1470345 RepID=UPI0004B2ACA0|nr:fimbrillin family protein [Bacteroides timonensis]
MKNNNNYQSMKNYLILATAALALTACSNNENEPADLSYGRVPVEFRASVGVTETRAIDQTWSATDAIGIFMVETGESLLPANISEEAENIRYVADATSTGTFKPDGATIYYPMDDSEVDFYAYCPQGSVTQEETTTNYLYAINVGTQSNQEALDLLYSSNVKGKKKTDKTAALTFKHQLCKVILTVQPGAGVATDDMTGLTVKVNAQNTTATFDLTAGALKADAANSADITLFKQTDAYVYEAILLPDAATSRTFEFDLNNDHDAPFTWNMGKALAAGSKYTYTVKLNRTGVEVSGQIEAWDAQGGGEVDAN